LAAIAGVASLNARGVRAGGRAQIVLTACKLASLAIVLGVGAGYAGGGLGSSAPLASGAVHAGVLATPWGSVLHLGAALIPVMWTFGGWDEATFVAEEVHEPQTNVPRAVLAGVLSVGVLYVLTNAAYLAVLGPGGLTASGTRTASVFLERTLGPGAQRVLDLALMLSVLGTLNAVTLSGARIGFAAARDNPALAWFARLHPRWGTPVRTLALESALAATAAIALADPFALLLYSAVAYWAFAGLMAASVIVLRRKAPDRPRPFRTPVYPLPSAVFALAAAAMVAAAARERPANAAITCGLLALGAAVFALQRRLADRV
jgi:APA family basic amino acid/polyamine antiporter